MTTRGTHWRNRRALGGELRRRLRRVYGRRYETWGLPGSNAIHIARRTSYQFPPHQPQACLFICAAPDSLRWGLHIPITGEHWDQLLTQLQYESTALALTLHLLYAYDLTLSDTSDTAGGVLGGCWRYEKGELTWREACSLPRLALSSDIPFRLSELPRDPTKQLSLFAAASAEVVMAWGADAADEIAPALLALVPLYEMCVDSAA